MSTPLSPAEDETCIPFSPTVTLLSLSDEVLLLILSYLPSLSLYHCSLTTTRLSRLTEDMRLVSNLSFRRTNGFTTFVLKDFLSPGPRLANIMKLNLNSAYWLPAGLVTECVVRLKNLTDLHIVDIRLSAKQLVSVLTNLTHLKQLSLTWCFTSKNEVEDLTSSTLEPSWGRLKGLCIYLPQIEEYEGGGLDLLTWVLALCNSLEELTVFADNNWQTSGSEDIIDNLRPMSFPCLKSLVLSLNNERTWNSILVRTFEESIVEAALIPAKLPNSTCFFEYEFLETTLEDYLKSYNKVAQKIHRSLTPSEVEPLLSTSLPSLTELSVECCCFDNTIKNLLVKKDWGNLKRLGLTTTRFINNVLNTQVIHQLAETEFPHLVSLALPLCCLLELEEADKAKVKIRVQRIRGGWQTSNKGLFLLAQNCPQLSHLEVIGHPELRKAWPCSSCSLMQGEKLLEALPQFTRLRALVIHKIHVVNFDHRQPLFRAIFRACTNLSELYISHLGNSCQKLVRDLALGLEVAQSLTVLRVQQTRMTQFPRCQLLTSLAKGCPLLDQLVLVDPAESHTLTQYPVSQLLAMVKTKDLSLLCVFSKLLTTEKIKELKEGLKKHAECSPHFVSCFTDEDVNKNIPGVFLKTVFSLYNKISDDIASGHGVQFDEIF